MAVLGARQRSAPHQGSRYKLRSHPGAILLDVLAEPSYIHAVARRDELQQQVRDALVHLHDVVYLQTHPLARIATLKPAAASRREAGLALRERLLATIEALRPTVNRRTSRLAPRPSSPRPAVYRRDRSGRGRHSARVGKSQFYREHERALAAVTSLVAETWTATKPKELADGAVGGEAPSSVVTHLPRSSTSFVGRKPELKILAAGLWAARDRAC